MAHLPAPVSGYMPRAHVHTHAHPHAHPHVHTHVHARACLYADLPRSSFGRDLREATSERAGRAQGARQDLGREPVLPHVLPHDVRLGAGGGRSRGETGSAASVDYVKIKLIS